MRTSYVYAPFQGSECHVASIQFPRSHLLPLSFSESLSFSHRRPIAIALYALHGLALSPSRSLSPCRKIVACVPFRLVIPSLAPSILLDRALSPRLLAIHFVWTRVLTKHPNGLICRCSVAGGGCKKHIRKTSELSAPRESTSISPPPSEKGFFCISDSPGKKRRLS